MHTHKHTCTETPTQIRLGCGNAQTVFFIEVYLRKINFSGYGQKLSETYLVGSTWFDVTGAEENIQWPLPSSQSLFMSNFSRTQRSEGKYGFCVSRRSRNFSVICGFVIGLRRTTFRSGSTGSQWSDRQSPCLWVRSVPFSLERKCVISCCSEFSEPTQISGGSGHSEQVSQRDQRLVLVLHYDYTHHEILSLWSNALKAWTVSELPE